MPPIDCPDLQLGNFPASDVIGFPFLVGKLAVCFRKEFPNKGTGNHLVELSNIVTITESLNRLKRKGDTRLKAPLTL